MTFGLSNYLQGLEVLELGWKELQKNSVQFGITNGNLPQKDKMPALFIANALGAKDIATKISHLFHLTQYLNAT